MIKSSRPWEWGYLAVVVALVLMSVFHAALHLPVIVTGFLLLPTIFLFIGLFFIIDNMRSRIG